MILKLKINKILFDNNLITRDKNIIHAPRAFVAHSAAVWCMKKISNEEFSQAQIDSFGKVLMMHLKGAINLFWEDGMLRVKYVEEEGTASNE